MMLTEKNDDLLFHIEGTPQSSEASMLLGQNKKFPLDVKGRQF